MENYEAIIEYIKELENENKSLKDKIKIVEQDRDEAKQNVQNILVKYLEIYAKKNKLNKEDLFQGIGEFMKDIIDNKKGDR